MRFAVNKIWDFAVIVVVAGVVVVVVVVVVKKVGGSVGDVAHEANGVIVVAVVIRQVDLSRVRRVVAVDFQNWSSNLVDHDRGSQVPRQGDEGVVSGVCTGSSEESHVAIERHVIFDERCVVVAEMFHVSHGVQAVFHVISLVSF